MNKLRALVVVGCVVATAAIAQQLPAAPGFPITMTTENHEAVLSSTPVSIAFFFDRNNAKAETAARGEVDTAAKLLKHMVTIGSVDVQSKENGALLDAFKIEHFPAVRFVVKNRIRVYDDTVTAKELVFAALSLLKAVRDDEEEQRESAPATFGVNKGREAAELLSSGHTVALGFFRSTDNTTQQMYRHAAKHFRGKLHFAEVNETIAPSLKVTKFPSLSLYNPELGAMWFNGTWSVEELGNWIEQRRHQHLSHLTNENWDDFNLNKNGHPTAVLLGNLSDTKITNWILSLRATAAKFTEKISFYYADNVAAVELVRKFGFAPGPGAKPKLAIWDASRGLHFNFAANKPVTVKSVDIFCSEFLAGSLRPTLKSAPRPPASESSVVETVTDTFLEVMNDPTADVVVLLYDKTARQTEGLLEMYKNVADKLQGTDGVVFAQMDTDANDLLPECAREVPSISIYPQKKKKQPASYSGAVRFTNIVDFVSEHATSMVDLDDEYAKGSKEKLETLGFKGK